jgi:hypothetical protein
MRFAEKAFTRMAERANDRVRSAVDRVRPTWEEDPSTTDSLVPFFARREDIPDLAPTEIEAISATTEHFLQHRFDILGSGWVQIRHCRAYRGMDGTLYRSDWMPNIDSDGHWLIERLPRGSHRACRAAWQSLDGPYVPLDWQVDVKSGFRWDERRWFRRLPPAPHGADIKVPWELGRMQHLPQLAVAARLSKSGKMGFRSPKTYCQEFCNQIRDFIAANPPRFGVQWSSPMEVAIRAVNWLVAYDLFSRHMTFDPAFSRLFARAIWSHGAHVANNLENDRWSVRNNHYLANLVGLVVIAAHLPDNRDATHWWEFARDEMLREILRQFHRDGGNFEGSVAYHGFGAEMAALGVATILARDPSFVTAAHFERLRAMLHFMRSATKPTGMFCQIGDNDSGKLLKLLPDWQREPVSVIRHRYENLEGYDELDGDDDYWVEKPLSHQAAIEMLEAILDHKEAPATASPAAAIVRQLVPDNVGTVPAPGIASREFPDSDEILHEWSTISDDKRIVRRIPIAAGATNNPCRLGFPDFGLFIYRSSRFFLSIRCGSIGQEGVGGHDHFDQLSIELWADGVDFAQDPGSGVYTASPTIRNAYRSASAHASPQIEGREPGSLDGGAFRLKGARAGSCLHFSANGFVGAHDGFGNEVRRAIVLQPNGILMIDYVTHGEFHLSKKHHVLPAFSPAYGWISAATGCRVASIDK